MRRLYAAIPLPSKGGGLLFLLIFNISSSILNSQFSILHLHAQGIPFFQNFTATEYKAHNQNFDIVAADDGTVYVANFEGLLYYDQASWRIIHTPGITRVTSLYLDTRGTLWTGGYNYIGHLATDADGILSLKPIGGEHRLHGEVLRIWETGSDIHALVSDGSEYIVNDSTLTLTSKRPLAERRDMTAGQEAYFSRELDLGDQIKAVATNGEGIIITDKAGNEVLRVSEANGLCSNNVSRLAYNGNGLLWGATDNGIFAMAIPSVYTRFTANEGLRGEVRCIETLGDDTYVGTQSGLYRLQSNHFMPVEKLDLGCWQLKRQGYQLLAATIDGLYAIRQDRKVDILTTAATLSVLPLDDGSFLTGEIDGVYLNRKGGKRQRLWETEKVVNMVKDDKGTLWMQNLYGSIWTATQTSSLNSQFSILNSQFSILNPYKPDENEIHTLLSYKGRVTPIATNNTEPFPFPLFSYADGEGLLWLTDNKGCRLFAMKDSTREEEMSRLVYPLMDYSVCAMMRRGNQLWMGGDKGLCIVEPGREDPTFTAMPRLRLRSVRLHGDSIIWGGYGPQPEELPTLASNEHHIVFDYSIDNPSLLLATQYRTRLNQGNWSAWETLTYEEYSNLSHGDFHFEVQARDAYGRLSDIVSIDFSIMPPLHMRWYMLLLYAAMLVALGYALMRFRLYQLEKDKHRLETVVKERTADLVEAQHELVRQEKMATVGKLTQGLIDRILNPLNYINNFSKLSENLVNDVRANLEDEKENISPDNYDDTKEVLDMLQGNLQKVGEHGASTARILKAMEEMLKDRTGGQTDMSLTDMLRHDEQMLHKYYGKEIATHGISTPFALPDGDIRIKGNAELLSMTVMSMLRNAVYAVAKKDLRPSTADPGPQTSDLRPQTSDLRPQTSDLRPQTSDLRPQTSDLRPQTSDLRPQTSDLRPQTSDLRPQTSDPGPQTSDLRPQTSDLRPQTSDLRPQTLDLRPYQPEVRLTLTTGDGRAIVKVRDNGIGIESTIIDRIFDPFFTTKTTGEASGVGLYISREIVQNHRGDITVESTKGEYTEFTITLPL